MNQPNLSKIQKQNVQWQCAFCWKWLKMLNIKATQYRTDHLELLHSWWCSEQTRVAENKRCIFSNTILTESLSVVHLELSPISLVELFLLKRKQMLELVFQNVKRMIINISNLRWLRKLLTKKWWLKNHCSVACKQSNQFWSQWYIQPKKQ